MKILFVTPYVPNQIRVRPYQFIQLLQQHHDVTLLCVQTTQDEMADLERLRAMGVRVYSQQIPLWRSVGNCVHALASGSCLQASYSWHDGLAKTLGRVIEEIQPDVVHVEHLRGARYGLYAGSYSVPTKQQLSHQLHHRVPIVWDSVDCISHLYEQAAKQSRSWKWRLMAQLELERTRQLEGWLVHQFDQVMMTSPVDGEVLHRLAKMVERGQMKDGDDAARRLEEKLNVVPNAIDLTYFAPNGENRDPATVVLTGKMSYHANVTAALHLVRDVMPSVWSQRPDTEVWIVGKDPSPEIRALASQGDRRVVVTGTVPDLRPYLHKATVAVAPIAYGAGNPNKVLEAMACATPVIASPQAVSALPVNNGSDLLLANDATAFGKAIVSLLENPQLRSNLGWGGRAYTERRHSWAQTTSRLEQVYTKATQARR